MTSIMSHGKYRQRTNSIPTLFSLEEESVQATEPHNRIPPKPPRRSSLAFSGINLGNRGPSSDKHNKRRSSIAVAFLGRHNKVNLMY